MTAASRPRSWPNTRGYRPSRRCRRSGRSATSSRTGPWPAARRCSPIARTFREKKLPCDTLIYLGTGFCPSGWNTGHGSFTFNPSVFPDPKAMLDELHALHFHVVPHVVIRARSVRGTRRAIRPSPDGARTRRMQPATGMPIARSSPWAWTAGGPTKATRSTPPRGWRESGCTGRARSSTGPIDRPFALHRNGYAGMQRYAAFLWSGDVYSTWETLKTHVPIAINTRLTGIPYWGTDIGGFVPTKELTGELYVRWFQFGAFCPLVPLARPDVEAPAPLGLEHRRARAERDPRLRRCRQPRPRGTAQRRRSSRSAASIWSCVIGCMPYLYSVVRECCQTGLPIIRAPLAARPRRPGGPSPEATSTSGAPTSWSHP